MKNSLIVGIVILVSVIVLGIYFYPSSPTVECLIDSDCIVFGETGDCNCGCYNKDNLPSSTGGECFCSAPIDCKCVNGNCEGIFEEKDQLCINSGGTVRTGLCCLSTNDFPNLCLIGACGCSPDNSHDVKICDCGEGKCFDGNTCVPEVHSFQECVDAGYEIVPPTPGGYTECRTPDGRIFILRK